MIEYKPHVFEHFGKTVRRMADIANRKGKKVFVIMGGIRFVAKPGRSHWPLVKFHDKVMLAGYIKHTLSLDALERQQNWMASLAG